MKLLIKSRLTLVIPKAESTFFLFFQSAYYIFPKSYNNLIFKYPIQIIYNVKFIYIFTDEATSENVIINLQMINDTKSIDRIIMKLISLLYTFYFLYKYFGKSIILLSV